MKKLAPLMVLLAATTAMQTQAYRFENNLTILSSETEFDYDDYPDVDYESGKTAIDASYFFQTVSIEKGPWQEAAFLSKASSIGLLWSDGEVDVEIKNGSDYTVEENDLGIAFRAVFGDFVWEAGHLKTDLKSKAYSRELKNKQSFMTFGSYIGDYQQWWVKLQRGDQNDFNDFTGIGGGYRIVMPLPSDNYISLEGSMDLSKQDYENANDLTQADMKLRFAFYLGEQLGFHAAIESVAGLDSDSDDDFDYGDDPNYSRVGVTMGVSFFPIQQLKLSAELFSSTEETEELYSDDSEADLSGLIFTIGGRF